MRAVGWEALILLFLIVGNGLFAMAEIALVSSRKTRLQHWADSGDAKARKALDLLHTPGHFLAIMQVGMSLIAIIEGAYGGKEIAEHVAGILAQWGWFGRFADVAAFWVVVLIIAFLQILIGELLPKAVAFRYAEPIARHVSRPVARLIQIGAPLISLLNACNEALLRFFVGKPKHEAAMTEEEISVVLTQGAKAGVFKESQQDMMESVIEMGERRVTSIMTARPDIAWIEADAEMKDIRAVLKASPFSRFPVCEGSFDSVLGVVHTKDILDLVLAGESVSLKSLAKPITVIPDSIPVLKALEAFRASGDTMAFVTDEYGSILGLVTLDDVLRNILGDMASAQSNAGGDEAVKRADGSWLIDGTKPMEEIREMLQGGTGEDEQDYQTLGGFVMARLGRIPRAGDYFVANGRRYEVVDMDGHRVDKVLVTEEATEEAA
jgi:putative hemolysin